LKEVFPRAKDSSNGARRLRIVPTGVEVVSKCQITFESQAQADEKAQHT
jgi:hypothetical protein